MRKSSLPALPLVCLVLSLSLAPSLLGQGTRIHPFADRDRIEGQDPDVETDNPKAREEWFRSGRRAAGEHAADLLHRAYRQKMEMSTSRQGSTEQPATIFSIADPGQDTANGIPFTGPTYPGAWTSLGPAPIASDTNQDYGKVIGRVTSVTVDPGDTSGNTVYIGAAFGGAWKSTNAAASDPTIVKWTPIIDDQPTLAVGAITVQPGTTGSNAVVLIGTGEANSSGDSYYGMGILRSRDGGATWAPIIKTADGGVKTFTGLGATKFAWNGNTVVVGMGSTNGKEFGSDSVGGRGIYYSPDAGITWHYATVQDPGGAILTEGTVTDVAYDPGTSRFYAFYRYHGFYESADGVTWNRSAFQPQGTTLLNVTNCPTNQPTPNPTGNCPLYRGQISIQPATNSVYVIYVNASDILQGVFVNSNPAASAWTSISATGTNGHLADNTSTGEITQSDYNLWIGAVPTAQGTDLLVGTRDIYKCSLSSPTSCTTGWMNLTFVYNCNPTAAPSHVHPDQHGFAFNPASPVQMYFVNDGGVYRSLNGTANSTGTCTSPNPFQNLDTNMGSLSEMISFSQDPTNENIILGGLQDNGSPALGVSGSSGSLWQIVNGADGGYNEIDPNNNSIWYTEYSILNNSLTIQQCTSGISCNPGLFGLPPFPSQTANIAGAQVANDTAEFYTPYIIDTGNTATSTLVVGTCRLWRGPGAGGSTWQDTSGNPNRDISPAFDSSATLPCTSSSTSTKVRAIAAGGPAPSGVSQVIYVGLEGAGTVSDSGSNLGHVFVNTNADVQTGTHGANNGWTDVTRNIAATLTTSGGSYGPYPISSIQIDQKHDATGHTAYVTVEGFGVSHVFKTTTAGQSWTDLTSNLPDAPVDSVAVDPDDPNVLYVGTDVGAFISLNDGTSWDILGTGLPNVPVTKIRVFGSNGPNGVQPKLLRVSTYGRGVWQFALPAPPPVDLSPNPVSFPNQLVKTTSSPLTVTVTNNTSASLTNIQFSVTGTDFALFQSGTTCTTSLASFGSCKIQVTFTPSAQTLSSGTLTVNSSANSQAVPLSGTGVVTAVTVSPTSLGFSATNVGSQSSAQAVTVTNVGTAPTTISVGTLPSGFSQTNTCSTLQPNANCAVNVVFAPTATSVNAGSFTLTDSVSGIPQTITLTGTASDFQIAAGASTNSQTVTAGQPATYNLNLSGTNGFSGAVNLSCTSGLPTGTSCAFSPSASVTVSGTGSTQATLTISTTAHSAAQPAPTAGSISVPPGINTPSGLLSLALATFLALAGLKPLGAPKRAFAWSALLGAMMLVPGCGGGGGTTTTPSPIVTGTPAGTYTVTVTATSGNRSQQMSLTLKVN